MIRSGLTRDIAPPQPFNDLRASGVLWAINKHLFHPQGFALAFARDDDGNLVGWNILGDGSEPWEFADDEPEASAFAALLDSRRATSPEAH